MMRGYFTASSSATNWSYTALWPNASMSRQATAAGRISRCISDTELSEINKRRLESNRIARVRWTLTTRSPAGTARLKHRLVMSLYGLSLRDARLRGGADAHWRREYR